MHINFSIILPCYNESSNIYELYKQLISFEAENIFFEIIFVNNGSLDNTGNKIDEIINNLNESKSKNLIITKLDLKKNQGYGGGITEGLKIAKGEFIGWTHADLQTPLIDFLKLYYLVKGNKKVFGKGKRINNRKFDSVITKIHEILATFILGKNFTEINAQPKIINREDLIYFTDPPKKWTTIDTYFYYISLINNFKIIELDVIFKPRIYGQSKWKNNLTNFIKHLFFNFVYLFKLKFNDKKNNTTKFNT